jgi:ribosomal protein L31
MGHRQWCGHGSHTKRVILQKKSKSLVRRGKAEKGKSVTSKNNMSRDDNVVGGENKTSVTFMGGFGREIRIAGTIEHVQVLIGGGNSMEDEVWAGRADRLGGEAV